ncbi:MULTISPECIES: hypothetical protein [unclassified Streptomyces]|uniref:hypothetical protein n=1 Tax=unclassified Streptomyces TaxID=2593676 RepID=UPI0036EE6D5D
MLTRHAHDALIVDTEGHGFLQAAYLNPRSTLVVHGVTHRVGQATMSPHAGRSAAEFALDFLARLPPGPADVC